MVTCSVQAFEGGDGLILMQTKLGGRDRLHGIDIAPYLRAHFEVPDDSGEVLSSLNRNEKEIQSEMEGESVRERRTFDFWKIRIKTR